MTGRRVLAFVAASWFGLLAFPGTAAACSPLFDPPTIVDLGPAQLVVMGRVGERVPGGRLFHVERWFNGGEPGTPIVIGFKEGPALGDCSYPVQTGERKIIAPSRQPDGTLYADLVTLQGDPETEQGRRYLAEAIGLFGDGVMPPALDAVDDPVLDDDGLPITVLIAAIVLVIAGSVIGLAAWKLRLAAPKGRLDM